MKEKKRIKKKYKIILGIFLILFVLLLGGGITVFAVYQIGLGEVSTSSAQKEIVIPEGSRSREIAKILKEKNLIRNEYSFLAYMKIHKINNLKFGTYLLSENMGAIEIMEELQKGSTYNPEAIQITFQEGLNMREIARIIEKNTNNSYEDVLTLANNIEYIESLKEKYWFITDALKNEQLFYKLEGYLYPNTYELKNKEVDVTYIFNKMLDEMAKRLEPYKNMDYSTWTIHDYLTLASIVEKESPVKKDRTKMAEVFFNRIKRGMNLGSDVTARYANKIDDKKKALSANQLNLKSPYNTRLTDGSMNGKLPVGPISNVSIESIDAVFHPEEDQEYLYFISNIQTLETFFYENYSDFLLKKEELKEVNQGF